MDSHMLINLALGTKDTFSLIHMDNSDMARPSRGGGYHFSNEEIAKFM